MSLALISWHPSFPQLLQTKPGEISFQAQAKDDGIELVCNGVEAVCLRESYSH